MKYKVQINTIVEDKQGNYILTLDDTKYLKEVITTFSTLEEAERVMKNNVDTLRVDYSPDKVYIDEVAIYKIVNECLDEYEYEFVDSIEAKKWLKNMRCML